MHKTQNDLSLNVRKGSIALLAPALASLIDLKLQAKQAHWNVKGPHFIMLHELFDAVSERLEGLYDIVAERIVQLGGTAGGTLEAVSDATTLPTYPLNLTDGLEHVKALSASMAVAGKQIRAGIDAAGELGDQDTADIFTEVSRALDKDLWFVESHLG